MGPVVLYKIQMVEWMLFRVLHITIQELMLVRVVLVVYLGLKGRLK